MDHQRQHRSVERLVRKPVERIGEIVHPDHRLVSQPIPGKIDHPRAVVEGHYLCTSSDELLCIETRSAPSIENPLPGYLAEKFEHGGPVIEGVVCALSGVALVFLGELIEDRVRIRTGHDLDHRIWTCLRAAYLSVGGAHPDHRSA